MNLTGPGTPRGVPPGPGHPQRCRRRPLLLPVEAVALNLISVGGTYGIFVLLWQHGHGSHAIWGLPATGAITNWEPLIAFAFLYRLSMDHEVFILTRIREEHDRTGHLSASAVGRCGRHCAAWWLATAGA